MTSVVRRPTLPAPAWPALGLVMALVVGGVAPAAAQEIVRVSVRPLSAELVIGEVVLLSAEATLSDGSVVNVSELVEWRSSNTGVARVSSASGSKGRVTAKGAGRASISVRDPVTGVTSGQSGTSAEILVLGRLKSLEVTPPDRSLTPGDTRSMRATGTFSNGVTRDLTEQVAWASSNPGAVQVSNEPGRRGRVTGIAPGTATISATSPAGISSTATGGDATVRVPAALVSIKVKPSENRLAVGLTLTLDAEGTFSDNSVDDVSNRVTWTSSAPGIATVSDVSGTKGEVTALADGSTLISVVDPASGISSSPSGGDALVTVAGALTSILIDPLEDELPTGFTRNFTIRGTLDDGTSFNLSRRDVFWATSDAAVASVSNERTTAGVVTALARGTTYLSAVHPPTGIRSPDATITVLGTMTGIAVRPGRRELFTGQVARFTAFALLDDGGEARLGRDIEFTSSNDSIASVSNRSGSRGDVTGVNKGRAKVSVVHVPSGMSSEDTDPSRCTPAPPAPPATSCSGTAIVSGKVEALRVDPPEAFYPIWTQPRLRARANFDDGSSANIGSDVVWTSSDPSIAEAGNEAPFKGVLLPKKVGRVTLSAVEPVSGISTTTSGGDGLATIVDGLLGLRVRQDDAALEMRTGDAITLRSVGRFPNPVTGPEEPAELDVDMTDFVEWVSSNPGVIRIQEGRALAVGLGEAIVTCRDPRTGIESGAAGGATFRVIAALERLKVRPKRVKVKVGSGKRRSFQAIGFYTDKAKLELTDRVEFVTDNGGVAGVDNTPDRHGIVMPVGPGHTKVMAHEPVTGTASDRPRTIVVKGGRGRRGR